MTELDSVPGGIGVTAWLSRIYSKAGYDVLGGPDGMIDGFRSLLPHGGTVLISAESSDYLPEMEWLTREMGEAWNVVPAEKYEVDDHALYRFFELFDWESIPSVRSLADAAAAGKIQITPPFKPHLEDKLWLALLWSPAMKPIWEKSLRGSHLQRLRELVPFGWVLDPSPPPLTLRFQKSTRIRGRKLLISVKKSANSFSRLAGFMKLHGAHVAFSSAMTCRQSSGRQNSTTR